MIFSLTAVVISQCVHAPKYHVLHLRYMQLEFVNPDSVKLENKKDVVPGNVWPWPDLLNGTGKGGCITSMVSPGGVAAFIKAILWRGHAVLSAIGGWRHQPE